MQNPDIKLRAYALKLFLVLAVASVLFQTFLGSYYVRALLPMIKVHLSWMYSDRRVLSFRFAEHGGEEAVIASSVITRPSKGITREISTEAGMYVRTFYIAPILVYSFFLTWPWVRIRKKLYGLLWPTLLLATVQSFFIALMLGSRIALSSGEFSKGSLDSLIYNGMASGGIHFVAVITFLLSIAPFHFHLLAPAAKIVGQNDPCPCGSDKKFKKCCGR